MLIDVDYRTTYRYDRPTSGLVQALRVSPRDHAGQHVINWRVDADVDGNLRESRDVFGNRLTMFYAELPVDIATLTVTGRVDVRDTAGLVNGPEPLPPPIFLRTTDLTSPDPAIVAFSDRFRDEPPLAALHGISRALHADMTFEVGTTSTATSAATALAKRRGVCQDFVHIFVATARRIGIPARYVSGHLARESRQQAAHAWAEGYVAELGWVGFDPTNGISPTDAYLRIAVGLDYLDAAPVRGARRGGGAEAMTVTVDAVDAMRQSQS